MFTTRYELGLLKIDHVYSESAKHFKQRLCMKYINCSPVHCITRGHNVYIQLLTWRRK
jgi:hypothetical protein